MSSQSLVTLGTLLNVVGLCFLIAANVSAARDRDRRERASGERPLPVRVVGRARTLMAVAGICVGLALVLMAVGFVTR